MLHALLLFAQLPLQLACTGLQPLAGVRFEPQPPAHDQASERSVFPCPPKRMCFLVAKHHFHTCVWSLLALQPPMQGRHWRYEGSGEAGEQ